MAPATAAPAPKPVQVYGSPAGEAALAAHYDEVLASLPWPCESRRVATALGDAHVLVCGPETGRPLMAWHGKGFPGPHMALVFRQLVDAGYRMYLPDQPCDAGSRTEPCPVDPANHGWGRWAAEVMEGLGLLAPGAPPAAHVGMSLGGAIILDLMAANPRAVGAAVLIVPICVAPGYGGLWTTLTIVWRLVLPIMLFVSFPCALTQRWACEPLMGDWQNLPKQLLLAWRHLRFNGQPPARFEAAQLAGFRGPCLAIIAENDILGGSSPAARRAEEIIPGCEAVVLPMKHAPTLEQSNDCVRRAAEFLQAKGFGPEL